MADYGAYEVITVEDIGTGKYEQDVNTVGGTDTPLGGAVGEPPIRDFPPVPRDT
jgi:hypothetical protein